jgi:ornithine cyclodeaminase/alanine dehydrogenase-like protein (mu-crystallin family)
MKVLYLEAHVIVLGRDGQALRDRIAQDGRTFGFWSSVLTADESAEEEAGDVILTTRDTDEPALKARMVHLMTHMTDRALIVKRYKIEAATLDSKEDQAMFKLRGPYGD